MTTSWDPELYERFRGERAQPFHDLVARVRDLDVRVAADLGCGTGELTRTLREHWPAARIFAVDQSEEMLRRGRASGHTDGLEVTCSDLMEWTAPEPLDLLVSNATLHWLPDHSGVLERLVGLLAPGGTIAVQMPRNEREPAYAVMLELLQESPWRDRFEPGRLRPGARAPEFYEGELSRRGLEPAVWETIYRHRMAAAGEILDWLRGAALRPFLSRLAEQETERFEALLRQRLEQAYGSGPVTFRFRRIFFTARRGR